MKWRKDSDTIAVSVMEHILCAFKAGVEVQGLQATQPCMGVAAAGGMVM